ncbi:putative metal-dependent hydrolase [Crenothrix polyspora]|uniref:Endoribonuclease YbeY n=1 Tax=Crenothrix polyspora TaxID=360316 RepID=A0A1R4H8N7_9GAMM|nr:putative metal-dependent hydrolase [Crenothrix polyspora]
MNYLELQTIFVSPDQPNLQQLQRWVDSALEGIGHDTEIVIRIVDEQESQALNEQYRHKQGPTNILSFPVDVPDGIELDLLGDLVICAPVVAKEALEQQKALMDHWAHIVIHGVLHLLGYDHIDDSDADEMESKEIALLKQLHINNPYLLVNDE